MKQYYIYLVRHPYSLKPIYVGKSWGPPLRQVTIGQSDNVRLEVLRQELLPVKLLGEVLADFDKESEAAAMEASLIKGYGCLEDGGTLYNEAGLSPEHFKVSEMQSLNGRNWR